MTLRERWDALSDRAQTIAMAIAFVLSGVVIVLFIGGLLKLTEHTSSDHYSQQAPASRASAIHRSDIWLS